MDRRKVDRRGSAGSDIYVFDLKTLAGVIWRRRVLLLALLAVIFGVLATAILLKPQTYTAKSSVILDTQTLNLSNFTDATPSLKFDDFTIDTQVKVIASSKLIYETLDILNKKSPDLSSAASHNIEEGSTDNPAQAERYRELQEAAQNLSVMPLGKSRVIQISYQAHDPYEAANFVNAHTKNYIEAQIASKREQVTLLTKWLSEQIASLKKESLEKSQAVQEFRKEAGIVLGNNSQDLVYQQISDIAAQLVPVEAQKLNLQARIDSLADKSGGGQITQVTQSSLIQNLKAQASAESQNIHSLRSKYGPDYPELISAQKRLSQINADIARESANIKKSIATELDAVTKQEALLKESLGTLNKQAEELREKEITLASLESEEASNRKILDSYMARYEEFKSQLDLNRADVRVVSQADVPTVPSGTPKTLLLLAAAMFSLAASLALVFLLELIDRGIEDVEEIKKTLNFRLLGILPKIKNPLSEVSGKKRSDYREEIKRIYLALNMRTPLQVMLFTSAKNGEGKATTALAYARYLTSISAKTIVVDLNVYAPSVTGILRLQNKAGVCEVLSSNTPLSEAIVGTDDGFSALPSGSVQANPIDLLAPGRFEALLDTLKSQFDYILIVSAPVTQSTDAEIIAGKADQTILVAEWAKTPKKILRQTAEILRQYARDVPNVIMNKRPF